MPITVADLAVNTETDSGTTLEATVPVGGVAQDMRVVVLFTCPDVAGSITCADARSNTYGADADVRNASGQRLVIFSAPVETALQAADLITISHPTRTNRAVAVLTVDGLSNGGAVDQANSGFDSSTTPSSGNITTTVADEALVGCVTTDNSSLSGFTPGVTWTAGATAGTSSGTEDCIANPLWRVVAATGTYAVDGSIEDTHQWCAGLVSYRTDPPPATTFNVSPVMATWVVNAASLTASKTFSPAAVVATWRVNPVTVTTRSPMIALKRWWRH